MPVGYLVTVASVAWCTLFALAPPRPRHSSLSNNSYWFGFLLDELPFAIARTPRAPPRSSTCTGEGSTAAASIARHGREYGADPTVVFVAGSSAGAHLAALAALTPNDPTFQPGVEGADTSVTPPSASTATTAAWMPASRSRPHPRPTSEPTRRRSSWPTATGTRWCWWTTPDASSRGCSRVRTADLARLAAACRTQPTGERVPPLGIIHVIRPKQRTAPTHREFREARPRRAS
jgi:alpha/beta hydrolase fold